MQIEIFKSWWTVDDVNNNPNKLFIFGDNDIQKGKGGQAIIRELKNTIGVPTKKEPNHKSSSYYTDDELETNKRKIDEAIQNIIIIIQENEYDTIVFPKDGLGTGRAKLHIKAPKTFKYLINKIDELKSIIV